MANCELDQYESFLQNASSIEHYLDHSYMSQYADENQARQVVLDCRDHLDYVGAMTFIEVTEFRQLTPIEEQQRTVSNIWDSVLETLSGNNTPAALFLVKESGVVRLVLGFGANYNPLPIFNLFERQLPEFTKKSSSARFLHLDEMKCGGAVTGAFLARSNQYTNSNLMDQLINGMPNHSIISFMMRPSVGKQTYLDGLRGLRTYAESYSMLSDQYGSGRVRTFAQRFPAIESLKGFLDKELERLLEGGNYLWETFIWYGASSDSDANAVGRLLSGNLASISESGTSKCLNFKMNPQIWMDGRLGFPDVNFGRPDYQLQPSLYTSAVTSIMTTKEVASILQFPFNSHNGISVLNYNVGNNHAQSFGMHTSNIFADEKVIELGRDVASGTSFEVSLDDYVEHTLITGGAGSGKTTTTKNLVCDAAKNNITFCLIEPAKKEYWKLGTVISDLKVYSAGFDALPLKINPLEPEKGTIIANHADALMRAFQGAFGMDTPTAMGIKRLLLYVYKKCGWNDIDVAYRGAKRFPTVDDLYENLDEYIEKYERSGQEVSQNILGALDRRTDSLRMGIEGEVFRCEQGLTGEELCSGHTLVELDDLSADTKAFVLTVLMIRMREYIQRRSSTHQLNNLIVLEEAHNIFPRITVNTSEAKKVSSEYFSNILTEIRGFGTGIVIVDQGASQINEAAVANTKIKIIHATTSGQDVNEVAYALGLSDFQKSSLARLKRGQAIIGIRGEKVSSQVQMNSVNESSVKNYACMYCRNARNCYGSQVASLVNGLQRKTLFMQDIYAEQYNPDMVKEYVRRYLSRTELKEMQYACAFGLLLKEDRDFFVDNNNASGESEREKRRVMYRYLY